MSRILKWFLPFSQLMFDLIKKVNSYLVESDFPAGGISNPDVCKWVSLVPCAGMHKWQVYSFCSAWGLSTTALYNCKQSYFSVTSSHPQKDSIDLNVRLEPPKVTQRNLPAKKSFQRLAEEITKANCGMMRGVPSKNMSLSTLSTHKPLERFFGSELV